MKNLNLILGLLIAPSLAVAASVSSVHGGQNIALKPEGKEASGRGVGNGVGEYVKDIFEGMATELEKFEKEDYRKSGSSDVFSNTPDGIEGVSLDIDGAAILELAESGRIHVVNEGSIFVNESSSYALKDGNLYLNAQYWDTVLKRENQEASVIQVLLVATDHEDPSGVVARYYAQKLKARGVDSGNPIDLY